MRHAHRNIVNVALVLAASLALAAGTGARQNDLSKSDDVALLDTTESLVALKRVGAGGSSSRITADG